MPTRLARWVDELALPPQNDSFTKLWELPHTLAGKGHIDRPIGNAQRQAIDPVGDIWPSLSSNTPTFREYIHSSLAKRLDQMVEIKTGNPELHSPFQYGNHRSIPRDMIVATENDVKPMS